MKKRLFLFAVSANLILVTWYLMMINDSRLIAFDFIPKNDVFETTPINLFKFHEAAKAKNTTAPIVEKKVIHEATVCELTLVTAYFPIVSKHSLDEYQHWMKNLLSLDACMIIHGELSDTVIASRANATTVYLPSGLKEEATKLNRSDSWWEAQYLLDTEKIHHPNYLLYQVWALKTIYLEEAIHSNPFRSSHFFWIDIGCMRDGRFNGRSMQKTLQKIPKDRFFIAEAESITPEEKLAWRQDAALTILMFPPRLAGACFGGLASRVLTFVRAYHDTFDRMAAAGGFVGKDQHVFDLACARTAGLCSIVEGDWKVYDAWFAMIPFLLGEGELKYHDWF